MTRKDKYKPSKTTVSEYFTIDRIVIRVSDHFGHDGSADISIVNPINSKTIYLVQVKEGPQVIQFSFKELKTFISHYCYLEKIKSLKEEVKQNKAVVSKVKKEEMLGSTKLPSKFNFQKDAYTSDGKLWCQVGTYLTQKYSWYKKTEKAYRNIL